MTDRSALTFDILNAVEAIAYSDSPDKDQETIAAVREIMAANNRSHVKFRDLVPSLILGGVLAVVGVSVVIGLALLIHSVRGY